MIDDIITPDDITTPDESTEFTIRVVDADPTPTVTAEATVLAPSITYSPNRSGADTLDFSSHEYHGDTLPQMLADAVSDEGTLLHVDGVQLADGYPGHNWFIPVEVCINAEFVDAPCNVDVELVDAVTCGAFDRAFDGDVHPDTIGTAVSEPSVSLADVWDTSTHISDTISDGATARHDATDPIARGNEVDHITGSDDDTDVLEGGHGEFAYYPAEDVSTAEDAMPDGVFDPAQTTFDYEAEFTYESADGFEIDDESIEDDVKDHVSDAVEYAIREGIVSTHDEKFDATGTVEDDDTADGEADDTADEDDDDAMSFSDSLSD